MVSTYQGLICNWVCQNKYHQDRLALLMQQWVQHESLYQEELENRLHHFSLSNHPRCHAGGGEEEGKMKPE
ncbi:hypothetical protein GN958_ATG12211 [Phytophthora infestans]|uniref:Uncharacterized protein n=1 Tax=Phytophthora infestans TaxID=4787 RepID=A0A8S9UDD2_PHYIN|nr:hypothetical protein GN958_ATG12211 [Phytophthora infestans]